MDGVESGGLDVCHSLTKMKTLHDCRLFGFLVITGAKGPINVGEESEENDTVLFLSHLRFRSIVGRTEKGRRLIKCNGSKVRASMQRDWNRGKGIAREASDSKIQQIGQSYGLESATLFYQTIITVETLGAK
ncbi:hypothetical protein CK203_024243 [Vitis vinifera]|uniref:Uncharacterized protein n=1 Tax=Vitis vinifera TaxID=29760 RepID=A0A438I4S6_VITVI|nr:hypothetical protein CK203_024243 [Vitis vinifera]